MKPMYLLMPFIVPTKLTRPGIHKINVIWKLDIIKNIGRTLCSKSCEQSWQVINYKRKETIGTYHRVNTTGNSEHLSSTTPIIPERTRHTSEENSVKDTTKSSWNKIIRQIFYQLNTFGYEKVNTHFFKCSITKEETIGLALSRRFIQDLWYPSS